MIPILRHFSNGKERGIATQFLSVKIYIRKCENARLASAILCVSSRFLTAAPWLLEASINSAESFSAYELPVRPVAESRIQRIARVILRLEGTSIGTW